MCNVHVGVHVAMLSSTLCVCVSVSVCLSVFLCLSVCLSAIVDVLICPVWNCVLHV